MRRKPKYKFWKESKNFRRKPKISEGNQKFWKENKIKFWKETKKIGIEILTPLGHRSIRVSGPQRIFADVKLCTGCSTKGAAHYSFRRALLNNFFGKVLLIILARA